MKNDILQLCFNYLKNTISSIKKEQNIKRYYNVVYYSYIINRTSSCCFVVCNTSFYNQITSTNNNNNNMNINRAYWFSMRACDMLETALHTSSLDNIINSQLSFFKIILPAPKKTQMCSGKGN